MLCVWYTKKINFGDKITLRFPNTYRVIAASISFTKFTDQTHTTFFFDDPDKPKMFVVTIIPSGNRMKKGWNFLIKFI